MRGTCLIYFKATEWKLLGDMQRGVCQALAIYVFAHLLVCHLTPSPSACHMKSYPGRYRPEDFPTEAEWSARITIEKSRAIKCPSLLDHLIGAKKMQQVLAAPGMLEKFAGEASLADVALIRSTFAGL